MHSPTEQDHNTGIQATLDGLKAELIKGLGKDEVVVKMKTKCLKTVTHIDHLCLEILAEEEQSLSKISEQTNEILKKCGIGISASKPRNLKRFDSGNVLISRSTGKSDRRVGAIKILKSEHKFKLDLNGYLCALIYLTYGSFQPIYDLAVEHSSTIRRLDIAFDDLHGKYDLRQLTKGYSAGRYNSKTGCKPMTTKNESETGVTRYIGSKNSEKRLRVYDKSGEVGRSRIKVTSSFFSKMD